MAFEVVDATARPIDEGKKVTTLDLKPFENKFVVVRYK
jgi:hypothetical protein